MKHVFTINIKQFYITKTAVPPPRTQSGRSKPHVRVFLTTSCFLNQSKYTDMSSQLLLPLVLHP